MTPMKQMLGNSYLFGANAPFIEELYESYLENPASVTDVWRDYFVSKKLYPNVDFYSGIVQRALGIPTQLFTGIFAMARTVGWIAQWNEMISDPEQKIGRPRQLFTGADKRDVPPMNKR